METTKEVKLEMKTSLREREAQSRELRKAIHASSGMDRWHAWQDKRAFGRDTRHLLLAYAFVRGMPYLAAEPKCGEFNKPSATAIGIAAMNHGVELNLDEVKTWLKGPTEAVAQAPVAA